jgi:biopolymer transport protein ExbD
MTVRSRRSASFPASPVSFAPEDEDEWPDITPLLDVVFILLIFFIVAAAFAVRGMEVDLPAVKNSRPLAGRIIELRLDENGNLSCEGRALTHETLGEYLRYRAETDRLAGMNQARSLVLRAAAKAPVSALVRVMDAVRSLGGDKLIIATGREGAAAGDRRGQIP